MAGLSDFNFINQSNPFENFGGGVGRAILGSRNSKFNTNSSYQPINQKLILVDTSYTQLMRVAMNVPHLNNVITKGAEMFSNLEVKHVNKNSEVIENSEVVKLLNKPNPLQTMESFLYSFYINNAIYSQAFCFKNKSSVKQLPTTMWWLPSGMMKINLTGKMYRQLSVEDIIESYFLMETQDLFYSDEIIHISEGVGYNLLKPISKIEALQMPLSNIVAAMKSNNIILTERGLIGFISAETAKDGDGSLPPDTMELTRIEKDYRDRYNLDSSNGHVSFTKQPIKWTPMTFDVSQLKLYEGLEDSFALICGAYGIDRDIFPSIKGSTYENKMQGQKSTYTNTMQPLADKMLNHLSNSFGLSKLGEKLVGTYDHLPIMQEDKISEGKAKNQIITGASLAYHDGIISAQTYAEMTDLDFTGDGIIKTPTPTIADNTNGK